jgi:2,4-dienoyl-CoA reductase (NADPH2)
VAIIGAGGIGFDVAELLSQPPEPVSAHAFLSEWGVDVEGWGTAGSASRGGLRTAASPASPRRIFLLQRARRKHGENLGKTTGWIHRSSLKQRGVEMLGGVTYVGIDDSGLLVELDGRPRRLEVDNVVVCAGQVARDELVAPLRAAGCVVHVIGGAEEAAELDAKRAIARGAQTAVAL